MNFLNFQILLPVFDAYYLKNPFRIIIITNSILNNCSSSFNCALRKPSRFLALLLNFLFLLALSLNSFFHQLNQRLNLIGLQKKNQSSQRKFLHLTKMNCLISFIYLIQTVIIINLVDFNSSHSKLINLYLLLINFEEFE